MSKERHKTNKYERQWARTANNKIRAVEKALKTASGQHRDFLLERLEFWKSGKRVSKRPKRKSTLPPLTSLGKYGKV